MGKASTSKTTSPAVGAPGSATSTQRTASSGAPYRSSSTCFIGTSTWGASDQEGEVGERLGRVHEHDRLAAHPELALDAAEPVGGAARPPVQLALRLRRQLGQDEVRPRDQLAVRGGLDLDVRDEPPHE